MPSRRRMSPKTNMTCSVSPAGVSRRPPSTQHVEKLIRSMVDPAGDRDRDATGSGVVDRGERNDLAVGGGDRNQAALFLRQPLRELGRGDGVTGAGTHG